MPDDIDNEEGGEGSEEAEAILADVPLEWDSLWPRVSAILQQLGDLDAEDLYLTLRYAPGPDVFSTVASSTKSYAQERAAELVGKKYIDGQLVDNPDPEFAITDSTREMLRGLVNDALEQGWSAAKVRDEIIQSYAFNPARALNIARTERSLAQNRGSLVAAKASGVVNQKRSELASEHPQDDECDLNAAQGWIDIDEPFESGDDCAPFHPSCACGTVYRQAPSDTEEGEPIEESATPLHDRLAKLAELYDSSGRRVWGAETVYKYNENHDPATGRFAEGEGLILTHTGERVFNGEPVPIESKPSKLEVGALGEKIAIAYAQQEMGAQDAGPLNTKANNFPVDCIQDHELIEVKTGLCSNGKTAQHWRATIGQPGKEESAWLKTASKEDKTAWNQQKSDAILQRKQATLDEFSKRLGTPVAGKTLTIILNPDTRSADIHIFDGFHSRIPWNSDQAKAGYVGTYKY